MLPRLDMSHIHFPKLPFDIRWPEEPMRVARDFAEQHLPQFPAIMGIMKRETPAEYAERRLEQLWSRGTHFLGCRYAILGGAMTRTWGSLRAGTCAAGATPHPEGG